MIYRHDKKNNPAGKLFVLFIAVAAVLLFLFFVPQSARFTSSLVSAVFVAFAGPDSIPVKNIESYKALLSNKEDIIEKNKSIQFDLDEAEARLKEVEEIESENFALKEILGRKISRDITLARVIMRPSRSPYDTLLIDAGESGGIKIGSKVFANGNTLVGTVEAVYTNTALVSLFSTPGREFEARLGSEDISITLMGRGGGSFEAVVPRALPVSKGDSVVVPSLSRSIVGYVEAVVSDPRDPFAKIFILSPISISTLRFVEVEK
ncbi:MAG: rod shape-determining protein MreC [Patescibacteria group bacterium]